MNIISKIKDSLDKIIAKAQHNDRSAYAEKNNDLSKDVINSQGHIESNKNTDPPTDLISGSQTAKYYSKEATATLMDFIDIQNPDEILARFGVDIYDSMVASDSHLSSVYQTRKLAIASNPWNIEAASNSDRDIMISRFVRDILINARGTISETLLQLADAVGKGFSVLEIVWKKIDDGKWKGKFGIDEFIFHKQKFWLFADKAVKKYRIPIVYYAGDRGYASIAGSETIPIEKLIIYSYNSQGSRYGDAAFKPCYWPTWFKKTGWKNWMIFLDKFSMPVAVGHFPDGATTNEQGQLLSVLESIQKETCLVIPDSMKVSFLEANRTGPISFKQLVDCCNAEISKVILGATQAVEEGSRGSYALSRTHSEVRKERIEADIHAIADAFQQQCVKRIVDYNFSTDIYPRFVIAFAWSKNKNINKELNPEGGRPAEYSENSELCNKIEIEHVFIKTYSNILSSYMKNKKYHPVNMKYFKKLLSDKFAESIAASTIQKIKDRFEEEIKCNSFIDNYEKLQRFVFNEIEQISTKNKTAIEIG